MVHFAEAGDLLYDFVTVRYTRYSIVRLNVSRKWPPGSIFPTPVLTLGLWVSYVGLPVASIAGIDSSIF